MVFRFFSRQMEHNRMGHAGHVKMGMVSICDRLFDLISNLGKVILGSNYDTGMNFFDSHSTMQCTPKLSPCMYGPQGQETIQQENLAIASNTLKGNLIWFATLAIGEFRTGRQHFGHNLTLWYSQFWMIQNNLLLEVRKRVGGYSIFECAGTVINTR